MYVQHVLIYSIHFNYTFTSQGLATPLHPACIGGHTAIVKLLVSKGAQIDVKDWVWIHVLVHVTIHVQCYCTAIHTCTCIVCACHSILVLYRHSIKRTNTTVLNYYTNYLGGYSTCIIICNVYM